ncbi:hypothetical protein PENTCL1PPCAC_17540, partial [Pristionchus entomophagus]
SMEPSLSLYPLIITETSLSLLSSLLNLLLLYILRRYLVFHDHLRSLVFQSHLFLLFSNFFVFLRGSFYLLHSSSSSPPQWSNLLCPSDSSPSFFIGQFLLFSIVICVERSYSTVKYDIYEGWTKHTTLIKSITAFWFLSIIFFHLSSLSLSISPISCPSPRLISTPVNDANLPIVIFGVFFLAFIPVFYPNYTKNEETLRAYVKQDYSSLNVRYQLKENTTTCRRFLVQNGLMAVLCLSMLVAFSLMTKEGNFHREIQYLFYPLAGIIISLNWLIFQDSIKRKIWNIYWDGKDALYIHWVNSVHWKKESEVPLLPT